ncbi:MAG: polymer-forming cytoskeletal protein [Nitrospinae bacterium]|nr:polymer-forming cytoskeletal protein [Nitrospinota bacterium]
MSIVELEEQRTTYSPTGDVYSDPSRDRNFGETNFDREKVVAFIGQGVEFKGTINYTGSVRIDGRLQGEIHTEGTLLVGEQAVMTATINAGTVMNKGQITGDIVATEKVLLLASANMDGSLCTPRLSIEEGVVFNGTIEMKQRRRRKKEIPILPNPSSIPT